MKQTKIAFVCSWGRTTQYLYDFYKKFTPNADGQWNYLTAVPTVDEADVVFIMEGTGNLNAETIKKLKTKRLYVVLHEPPDIIPTHRLGLNAVHPELRGRATLVSYLSQPIWYFSKWELIHSHSHQDFMNLEYGQRTGKLSCLISGKMMCPGHIKRLNFIKNLIKKEQDLLTLYGRNTLNYSKHRGPLSSEKKHLAYEGFQYTLCFENSCIPNYFSDKIFDALLMWSMPIYWGAPNVKDYLPPDSFHMLGEDLDSIDLEKVKTICEKPPTQKNIKAMAEARKLILNKFGLWPSLQHVLEQWS